MITNRLATSAALGAVMILLSSFVPAIAGTVEDKIVEAPPPEKPSPWHYVIEPYGWLTELDGTTGAGGLTTDINVSVNEVLSHLDFAFFMQGEVRYDRWSIIANGYYAKLSAVGDPPGPFYDSVNLRLEQGLVELALAYRLAEGKYGFVDIFAGARYDYLGLDLSASVDSCGVQKVSENASQRISQGVSRLADAIVASGIANLEPELRRRLAKDAADRVRKAWEDLPGGIRDFLKHPAVSGVLREVADERRELTAAIVEQKLAADAAARSRADKRISNAEKDLANALAKEIKKRLITDASGNEQWVDPFVGFRGQLMFLAARADIGGFGVSSDLVWQVSGSVGYKLPKNLFTEAGYRYLKDDYTNGGFTYDVAASGFFMGLGLTF